MADSYTANLNLTLPEVGASRDTWGGKVNADMTAIDTVFNAAGNGTSVGLNVGSGKTLNVTGTANLDTAVVINESGADKDFRVEGDTDANLLFTDASTDRVGVGKNNPQYKFDVAGDIATSSNYVLTGNQYIFSWNGGTSGQVRSGAFFDGTNQKLSFYTATNERVTINSSGNVGIGTASPSSDAISKFINVSDATSSGLVLTAARKFSIYSGSSSNLVVRDETAADTRMVLDSSGNVGIATSSPGAKLHVAGSIKSGTGVNSPNSQIMVNTVSGTAAGIQLYQDGNESWVIANPASSTDLTFAASGNVRVRIDNAGNVGVGASPSSGNGKFLVSSNSYCYSANTTVANTSDVYYFNFVSSAGGQNGYIFRSTSTGLTQLVSSSDARLKDNIQDAAFDGMSVVNGIKVREFDWKDTGTHSVGFVAQELNQVCPDAVSVGEDAEDGSIKRPWGVSREALVPYLVKAVQELKAELDAANARIAALEAK